MRHIRIYEQFDVASAPEMIEDPEQGTHFESESTDFRPTTDEEEGEYVVNFVNPDGEETTINIGSAKEPEYVGDSMVSSIDMVQDSSSDGKQYSIMGYYDEIPDTGGAYELKKVLVEEV